MSSRNNVIELLARSAPDALGYLQIPLTPSTAARLADFTARTGIDAQALVLDLLEDAIFDVAGSVVSSGGESCTGTYLSELRARQKSPDINAADPTKLSVDPNSALSPRSYGLSTPQPRLPPSLTETSEQPNAGSQVSSSRQTSSSRP